MDQKPEGSKDLVDGIFRFSMGRGKGEDCIWFEGYESSVKNCND